MCGSPTKEGMVLLLYGIIETLATEKEYMYLEGRILSRVLKV